MLKVAILIDFEDAVMVVEDEVLPCKEGEGDGGLIQAPIDKMQAMKKAIGNFV